jgi:hypothetical protein
MEDEEGSLGTQASRGLAGVTSPAAVRQAMAEFDELGRDQFLTKYGFGKSSSYFLAANGRRYDSKAIIGAAHGFEHPELGPLASSEFSGGESTVRPKLESLGFEVAVDRVAGEWTRDRFLEAVGSLNTSSLGGAPAPHKPLLTLLALARWESERATELVFSEIAEPLTQAIRAFVSAEVREVDPSQPFWRLQTDSIWQVDGDGLPPVSSAESPSRQVLDRAKAVGGFIPAVHQLLESDVDLVWEAADRITGTYFAGRQRQAMNAVGFNRPTPRVWWVNQGQSFAPERAGGYVWAPVVQKNGRPAQHHTSVSKLRTGDVVLSYSKKKIRSVSAVIAPPERRMRPSGLPEVVGVGEGHYCELEYFDLDDPIELSEIPDRTASDGPFDSGGGVLQGYLYRISDAFAERLKTAFVSRWPAGSPFDPWDEFVYWAGRILESDEYRAAEPEWKRSIVDEVAKIRDAVRANDPEWPVALKRIFRKANLVDRRPSQTFVDWVLSDPGSAAAALNTLWNDAGETADRIVAFLAAIPVDAASSPGARAAIASFLLMGSDPSFVIYRPTPFDAAYRLTGHKGPPTHSEVDRLDTAWAFLDTFIAAAHDRSVHIEDRIDAQSLVWSITKNPPPASWSRHDQRAFEQYRSGKDAAMSQALTVYLGNSSQGNLAFSLDKGKWGWKQTAPDYDAVQPGDLIVLASGFTEGNVRIQPEEFAKGGFGRVDIGRITSTIAEETEPYWPDESNSGTVKYPHRVALELIETRSNVTVADLDEEFGGDIGEGVRRSAIGGHGVLVQIENDPFGTPTPVDFSAVVDSFAAACRTANLDYGQRHLALVRAFIASLATKRFVILTGLSGSGKTRLAMALGQWFGAGQSTLIAVRPDWTSPDALFGYENGLSKDVDGQHAWQVPSTLEFMLRAAADPTRPYLLILDEMNLAHVERYFADVLSGMESGEPILPNLQRNEEGEWRAVGDPLPLPSNLFVVGTVNVDETTYMFSPKVLDRANTIEFRVETADLIGTPGPLGDVASGSPDLVASFLSTASTPPEIDTAHNLLGPALLELHGLLSTHSREFGHRTFSEALRFTALLDLAGETDPMAALDLQVLQKVLPKFHGSVREIAEPLTAVSAWAFVGPGATPPTGFDPLAPPGDALPALPLTFEKTARMTRRLRANHFVSFTE